MTGWQITEDGKMVREKLREMLKDHREKYPPSPESVPYHLHLLYSLQMDVDLDIDEINSLSEK